MADNERTTRSRDAALRGAGARSAAASARPTTPIRAVRILVSRAAWAASLGVLLVSAACTVGPSPSPSAAAASSTPAPYSTPSAATAQFNLFLRAPAPHTTAFRLFVQTDPATIEEAGRTFCGGDGDTTPACNPARFPFTIRIDGLRPGAMLSYRFERVDSDGSVETLDQGSAQLDRAVIREVAYPTPAPPP